MIRKYTLLIVFFYGVTGNLFCQDTIPSSADTSLKEHYFEGYVYLISQDVLGVKDAYTVATSLNIIGEFVLLGRRNKNTSTHLDYWFYTTEPSKPEESVPDMAQKAGLLWNTNDLGSNIFLSGIGVFAIRQQVFKDKLSIKAGKIFPGVYYQSNYYAPNNSETHMNNILTGNPTSSWFGSLGLGLMAEYNGQHWFGKAGIHDATAIEEVDFKTLSDGVFLYIFEGGVKVNTSNADRRVSLLYSYVDARPDKAAESAWSLGGVYEFSKNSLWSVYGRYTMRNGGTGLTEEAKANDNTLRHGGFIGSSRKSPFHWKKAEIGLSYFIGAPTDYQVSIGSRTQTGIETYFKMNFKKLIQAAFDLQLISTGKNLEPIIGIRLKAGWGTTF